MDIQSLSNTELLTFAFGLNDTQASEAVEQLFPAPGAFLCRDSISFDVAEKLNAALEIDRRRALQELPSCRDIKDTPDVIKRIIGGQDFESFWCIYLGNEHAVISAEEAFRGTISQSVVYPREVVKRALLLGATAVIFAHNHPSGSLIPSHADKSLTTLLKSALELIDVRVLDHFIMTRTGMRSMQNAGFL